MASLAEVRVEEAEPMENESQARPEELRLLEALLFASNEPLDTATLAKRMPEGVDVNGPPVAAGTEHDGLAPLVSAHGPIPVDVSVVLALMFTLPFDSVLVLTLLPLGNVLALMLTLPLLDKVLVLTLVPFDNVLVFVFVVFDNVLTLVVDSVFVPVPVTPIGPVPAGEVLPTPVTFLTPVTPVPVN